MGGLAMNWERIKRLYYLIRDILGIVPPYTGEDDSLINEGA